jgi:hypothetical protein
VTELISEHTWCQRYSFRRDRAAGASKFRVNAPTLNSAAESVPSIQKVRLERGVPKTVDQWLNGAAFRRLNAVTGAGRWCSSGRRHFPILEGRGRVQW